MSFVALRARVGTHLSLYAQDPQAADDLRLTVAVCERETSLTAPAGVLALACPIAGTADVVTADSSVRLGKTDIAAGDVQMREDIVVSSHGACIVIAGSAAAWAVLGGNGKSGLQSAFMLFPAVHRGVPAHTRSLLRVTRHCLKDGGGVAGVHLGYQLARLLDNLQSEFTPMIARCPGPSILRKKAVFLRLQRVRNYISACANEELDVAELAFMANYSVGHFITTFRSVFEETPYSNINRYRMESASALLSRSTLLIADISRAIGFQSRSSFSRAIRRHLGSSAKEFRQNADRFSPAPDPDHVSDEIARSDVLRLAQSP